MEYIWCGVIILNFIMTWGIVFFQRRDPKTVWAWLLVLYFLPIVGFVLYLFIGRNFYCEKKFRDKGIEDKIQSEACKQEEYIVRDYSVVTDKVDEDYKNLIKYNLRTGNCVYTEDNQINIYTDGNQKFDALLKAIDMAEKFVFLQYYIIREDILLERICRHLRKRIAAGVKVYILADGIGTGKVSKAMWEKLDAEGFFVCKFFPPAVVKKLDFRVNYRNHRKIVVIDGKVGFLGGFNIGKEYLGINKKYGYWRDTHLKLTGSAVKELSFKFIQDWNYAVGEDGRSLKYEEYLSESNNFADKLCDREQSIEENKVYNGGNNKIAGYEKCKMQNTKIKNCSGMQIISSGPDSRYEQIRDSLLYMIHHARKNIYIQTPYFIPDEAVFSALRMAAQSDIEVKIMLPCKPDHPFVYWATLSFAGDLIRHGAKCYLYQNGFLHAKTIMVDGVVASVGTANMDIRSFKLNFEINAMIYDSEVTKELEQIFLKDIGRSRELTLYDYRQRSFKVRVKEQVSRLLAPLL